MKSHFCPTINERVLNHPFTSKHIFVIHMISLSTSAEGLSRKKHRDWPFSAQVLNCCTHCRVTMVTLPIHVSVDSWWCIFRTQPFPHDISTSTVNLKLGHWQMVLYYIFIWNIINGARYSRQLSQRVVQIRAWISNIIPSLIAMFMGPIWGPFGADRTKVGPMLAQWTLLSGMVLYECIKSIMP